MAKKIAVNLPDASTAIYRPDPYGPDFIVGVSGNNVKNLSMFSLSTGKRLFSFTGEPEGTSEFCFSPDAKLMATHKNNTGEIEVWNLKSGEVIQKLSFDESEGKGLHHLMFTDPEHILIMQWIKPDLKMSNYTLFDLSQKPIQGKPEKTFTTRTMYYNDDFMRSPGDRYIAGKTQDRKGVLVLDWREGKLVGELKLPQSDRGKPYDVKGIGFSPDGQKIAVFGSTIYETAVLGYSTATGKNEWTHRWPQSTRYLIAGALDDTAKKAGFAVNWLPDSTAFSLMGRILVDAQSGKILWYMESRPGSSFGSIHNNRSFYLTRQGMLSIEADGLKRQLQLKAMSLDQIQKSLSLLGQPGQALLDTGKEVALEIEIAQLHVADKDEVQEELTKIWIKKLEDMGLEVVDDAPLVLHFDYRELPGKEWTSQRKRDQKFLSTKIQYRIQWIEKGRKKAIWEIENEFVPSTAILRGEATVKSIRNDIFKQFSNVLQGQVMVYYLPEDPKMQMLPQFDSTHY